MCDQPLQLLSKPGTLCMMIFHALQLGGAISLPLVTGQRSAQQVSGKGQFSPKLKCLLVLLSDSSLVEIPSYSKKSGPLVRDEELSGVSFSCAGKRIEDVFAALAVLEDICRLQAIE